MNVIIDNKKNYKIFIANVNRFDMSEIFPDNFSFVTFYNSNNNIGKIPLCYVIEMMSDYIPLQKKELMYNFIKRNIKHYDIIQEKTFNALILAYKNNEDIYIIQEIKNIIKEYFETQGQ